MFQLSVDLFLPGSGITVLFGDSGSGKTTLLRCIAGLEQAPQGFLEINGKIWHDSAKGVFSPTHKRPLGYVFQEANLFPHLTVLGNIQFGLRRIGQPLWTSELHQIIELMGISPLLDRLPHKLSGGESQRVAIARALALKPELLLMDEPLASLDFRRKQEILPYLIKLHQQTRIPILYVTHSLQEAAQLADYLVILSKGHVLASGPLPETLGRIDIPLAHEKEAITMWEVTVARHEPEHHLTYVTFAGGTLCLPAIAAEADTPLRLQIYAHDVSIALEMPIATSILNILPATITDVADNHQGRSVVQLKVGDLHLLAHITSKSAQLLKLKIGVSVNAQIKGTAILN